MVQIVPYREDGRLAPVASEKQRAVSVGFGQDIGQGMQQAAKGVGDFAEGLAVLEQKTDEARVMALDAAFGDAVRPVQSSYLSSQGENAISAHETALKTWDEQRMAFLGRATGSRQQAMLARVLDRRRGSWIDQADGHRIGQTEVYRDSAEQARIVSLGNDITTMPDGPDRLVMIAAQEQAIRDRFARQGIADGADAAILEAQTVIHQNTIGAIIESGDPTAARDYLDRWGDQIEPRVRTTLTEQVREEVDNFDAQNFWDNEGIEPAAPQEHVEVEGESQTLTLHPPVSAAMGSRFGPRRSPGGVGSSNHQGVDYPVPVGTPVTASLPGVVRWRDDPDGYGRYAVIDHGNGLETAYAHLSAATAREGQVVQQGDTIGLSGGARGGAGAGNSQGPHVHYEVRRNGQRVNPEGALGGEAQVRVAAASAGTPTTIDDVRDRAREAAGGDYRRRAAFERAGLGRLSQDRQARADREGEAGRALDEWIVANPNFTSADQIPRNLWGAVSPSTRRQTQNLAESNATGESSVDPAVANDTFALLADEAAGAPATFLQRDLTAYRGTITEGQLTTLRATARSLRQGSDSPERNTLMSGVSEVVDSYIRDTDIDVTTTEGAEAKARAIQYILDQFNDTRTAPQDRNTLLGITRLAFRQVRPVDANGDGRRGQNFAFDVRPGVRANEVLDRSQTQAAVASLRQDYRDRTTFTQAEIEARHRRLTYQGSR